MYLDEYETSPVCQKETHMLLTYQHEVVAEMAPQVQDGDHQRRQEGMEHLLEEPITSCY